MSGQSESINQNLGSSNGRQDDSQHDHTASAPTDPPAPIETHLSQVEAAPSKANKSSPEYNSVSLFEASQTLGEEDDPASETDADEPVSVGTINLVPDGDMLIALSNFNHEDLKPWVCGILNQFRPAGIPEADSTDGIPETDSPELPDEIHVRVIQSFMRVISDGFKTMLRIDGAKEEVLDDGTRVYRDNDDAGELMIMLLFIIHGKSRQVPRELTLVQLADACVIADKYRMLEAVELMMDIWRKPYEEGWTVLHFSELGPDIPAGLCVGHVLRMKSMLAKVVEAYLLHGIVPLHFTHLPFPETILTKLNTQRLNLRTTLSQKLQRLADYYLMNTGVPRCNKGKPDCDAMAYGSLIMRIHQSEVFSYPGFCLMPDQSLAEGLSQLRSLRVATICAPIDSYGAGFDKREIHEKVFYHVSRMEGPEVRNVIHDVLSGW